MKAKIKYLCANYSQEESNTSENDDEFFYDYLEKNYPWFDSLSDNRKIAITFMAFMGIKNFESFKVMLSYFDRHDYQSAAREFLNSDYAKKFNDRADKIANIIIFDEL